MLEPVVLENGIESEVVTIPTANPANYFEAISNPSSMHTADIEGHLFSINHNGPSPVVVIVPGSLGISAANMSSANDLTSAGISAFLIDPFGGRGVSSTVANQAQYSFAASAWDVFAASQALLSRSDIDDRRIGTQGHSRGGTAVLSACCMQSLVSMPAKVRFAGTYAAYPWCGHQFRSPTVGETRVRSVIGTLDEWCSPSQVEAYMNAMTANNADASFRLFEGAHHSFDRDTPVELIADAVVALQAPTVYVRHDGALIHPETNKADPELTERELMVYALKAGYGTVGARIGSRNNQRQLFREDMLRFWNSVMFED